jgi:maltose O-acetyltransferase
MRDQAPEPPDRRSQRDRMLAGELYIGDDPQLAADHLRALTLTRQFNNSDPGDPQARLALLRELLGSVGEGTEIRPPLYCDYGYQSHVGARTFINFGCVLLDVATIQIGDDVQVGPGVQFLTPTHPVEAEPRRAKWEAARPISVGDNVWLGGGVIIGPGVSIGENTEPAMSSPSPAICATRAGRRRCSVTLRSAAGSCPAAAAPSDCLVSSAETGLSKPF